MADFHISLDIRYVFGVCAAVFWCLCALQFSNSISMQENHYKTQLNRKSMKSKIRRGKKIKSHATQEITHRQRASKRERERENVPCDAKHHRSCGRPCNHLQTLHSLPTVKLLNINSSNKNHSLSTLIISCDVISLFRLVSSFLLPLHCFCLVLHCFIMYLYLSTINMNIF